MKRLDPKTLALLLRVVIGVLLLFVALGIYSHLEKTAPKVQTQDAPRSLRVPVIEARAVELPRQWRGFGTVEADNTADVPARVGATVVSIPEAIEVGRVVKAGELLVKLDDTDFQKDFASAQQRLAEVAAGLEQLAVEEGRLKERLALEIKDVELARADYDRQVDRAKQGGATPTDIDRAQRTLLSAERVVVEIRQAVDGIAPRRLGLEAQQKAAEAQRDLAEENVKRATIVSPIDGIIAALDVEVGENVAPGARVARIIDPHLIEVPIQLPASARGNIQVGDSATVMSRSHPPDCTWEATVTRVGAINDPTRTFTVYARIDQGGVPLTQFASGGGEQEVLVPGEFVTARLTTSERRPRWIVPARSIQEGRIRLVRDKHVESQPVTIDYDFEGTFEQFGVSDDQWVVLKGDLAEGERIVLSASLSILDGQEVVAVLPSGEIANGGVGGDEVVRNGGEPVSGDTP